MQSIDSYSSDNDYLRLVLQGPPGSGKTHLACTFPGVYFIDVDVNLGGPLRYFKEHKLALPVGYDVLDKDDQGKPVPMPQRFQRLEAKLNEMQKDARVQTVVLDSGTTLVDVLIAEVCRKQNKASMADFKDGRQFWMHFAPFCRSFFGTLTSLRRHVVLIVHESINKNEAGAVVFPIKVAWPGQVGSNIGAFFTNNWRTETKSEGFGPTEKTKFFLRTSPTGQYELKNTLGLPTLLEADQAWPAIQAALDKGKK